MPEKNRRKKINTFSHVCMSYENKTFPPLVLELGGGGGGELYE